MKSKLPVPTAKDINEAHRLAESSAKTAVEHAIRCGQMLIEIGADEAWVKRHTNVAWSTAKRYITAAKKNAQGIAFESLRHCFPSGHKTRAAAEKRGETATAVAKKGAPAAENDGFSDTSAPSVKGAVMNPPESAAQGSEAGNRNTPSGVVSEQVRPPAPEPDSDAPERPDDVDEDAGLAAAEADYQRRIDAVMSGDAKLAASMAQLKQQSALIGTLEMTRDGYMRGKEAVTQLLKAEQRKTAKLEKELARLREENEQLRERIAVMEEAA